MSPSTPQDKPRDAFGDEILPFDGNSDLLNLNAQTEDSGDEEQPIDWDEVEAEVESWTEGGEAAAEGGKDTEDL